MHEHGTVSVIIPAYNAERYLAEAIQSVLAQDSFALQLIVVDDGSTDGTAKIAQSFGARVQTICQPNGGVAAALNHGLADAQGEWLAFCAADDLWTPGRLEKQMSAFAATPAPDLILGHVRQFFSPELSQEVTRRYYCPPEPQPGLLLAAMLLKRATFDRVGSFNTAYTIGEFIDWFARAQELGLRPVVLPDVVLWRRLHADNLSTRAADHRADFARILKAAMDRRRKIV